MKKNETCIICGEPMKHHRNGIPYCKRHYLQMYRHNKILDRTIYDSNNWKLFADHAECTTYDKNGNVSGIIKVDLNMVEKLKQIKIYCRKSNNKLYGCVHINNKKFLLHRYIMGIHEQEFTMCNLIDHINGDSLDNRLCNLRICTAHQNAQNNKFGGKKVVGVRKSPYKNNKWIAQITIDYKNIWLGCYDTYEKAVIARLKKEQEACGEYGPNKDLFYILNYSSPIEELKKVLSEEV